MDNKFYAVTVEEPDELLESLKKLECSDCAAETLDIFWGLL